MGLFVSWLPILILCSILDRNPVASDDIQRKLNKLVDLVCDSLLDTEIRQEYTASCGDLPQSQQMEYWVEKIAARAEYIKRDFFCGFAGQARTRFHYGAAFAILIEIEKAYIAERGRNWLSDPREARTALVLGQLDKGFTWLYVSRICLIPMLTVFKRWPTNVDCTCLYPPDRRHQCRCIRFVVQHSYSWFGMPHRRVPHLFHRFVGLVDCRDCRLVADISITEARSIPVASRGLHTPRQVP